MADERKPAPCCHADVARKAKDKLATMARQGSSALAQTEAMRALDTIANTPCACADAVSLDEVVAIVDGYGITSERIIVDLRARFGKRNGPGEAAPAMFNDSEGEE
jgi:hypothetical protein